jgi:hypothetical protein
MTLRNSLLTTVFILFAATAGAADRLTDKDVRDQLRSIASAYGAAWPKP